MLNKLIIIMIGILLLTSLVSAHAIEKGPQNASVEGYNLEFSIEPKFPLTGKDTHLDFIIKDDDENLLQGLNVKIELHGEETIDLNLNEEQRGHYSVERKFKRAGDYEIHIIIEDKELEAEFDLEIDSFGRSGLLRSGTIVILMLILIILAYRDCKWRKNGKRKNDKRQEVLSM